MKNEKYNNSIDSPEIDEIDLLGGEDRHIDTAYWDSFHRAADVYENKIDLDE